MGSEMCIRDSIYTYIQGSPSECGSLGILGVSQVEKGEHRHSFVHTCTYNACERMCDSLLVVYPCCWDVCTARVLFKFRGRVGWNRPDCVQDETQVRTDPHTHREHRSWLSQREYLEMRRLLHHSFQNVQSLEDYVIHSCGRQQGKTNTLKLNRTSCSWFLRTACCQILAWMIHTQNTDCLLYTSDAADE